MSLENSPKSYDLGQVKRLLPNFSNEIGSEFGLSELDSRQALSAFISDVSLRDSLNDIELEPQQNVHESNIKTVFDDLVRISSFNDDIFKTTKQELKQFHQLLRKQVHLPEQINALEDLRVSLDNESLNYYREYIDQLLEQQNLDIQKYLTDSINTAKAFALKQYKDLVKKNQEEISKAFYKSIADTIESMITGAEMELNSLQHYQLTLKFMLLVFDKGSMAFMSTMGAIDSLNQILPAFMNNLKSLQGSHSSAVRMMNKFSD